MHYRKEVLKVGTWLIGEEEWNVDEETLEDLVKNFRLAKERGVEMPVVWNHSKDARDTIALIEDLHKDGEKLFVLFEAERQEDIERIGTSIKEVSPEVLSPWRDGLGNEYSIMLTHMGLVNHPVVAGQENFQIAMRLTQDSYITRSLAVVQFEKTFAQGTSVTWDGAAARTRLAVFAKSRDDDLDLEKKSHRDRYKRGFGFVREDGKRLSDYILPHHTIENNRLKVNLKGVRAAIAAINGARGGVKQLSKSELRRTFNHLVRHIRTSFPEVVPPIFRGSLHEGEKTMPHLGDISDEMREELRTRTFQMVSMINELLAKAGSDKFLPEDTEFENLAQMLAELTEGLQLSIKNYGKEITTLRLRLNEVTNELQTARDAQQAEKKSKFVSNIESLILTGRIEPARKDELIEIGGALNYKLSMLEYLEAIPEGSVVPLNSKSKPNAKPGAPETKKPIDNGRAKELAKTVYGSLR